MTVTPWDLERLACPGCHGSLVAVGEGVRCERCRRDYPAALGGLRLLWELVPDAEHQANLYDGMSGEVSDLAHPHNLTLLAERHWLDELELAAGDRVLEISGHRSGTLAYLEPLGVQATGVDVSPVWVQTQNRLARARGSTTIWHQADAGALPFRDGTFDAVVAFDVLEHVPDLSRAVDSIVRVLAPGGRLLCHQPVQDVGLSLDGLQKRLDEEGWRRRQASVGHDRERIPTKDGFAAMLRERGMDLVAQRPFNVWLQPLHDHKLLAILGSLRRRTASPAPATSDARAPTQVGASEAQRRYARWVLPVVSLAAWPDRMGARWGVGGSCAYLARKR